MKFVSIDPKRVFVINRFFFPDRSPTSELLSDLAFALGKSGCRVIAITSRLRYDDRAATLQSRDVLGNVEIRRVWSFRSRTDTLIGRSLEYLSFYVSAGLCLWRAAERGDVIIAKTDPPLLSILAAPIARLKGARLINWLQDLFPEVATRLGVAGAAGRPAFHILRRLRNRSLKSAYMNVVPGHWMLRTLKQEGIDPHRIGVISNWTDGSAITPIAAQDSPFRKEWNLDDRVTVVYAGNFGRAHDFETIIEAIKLHQDHCRSAPPGDVARRIVFLLIGGGPQREQLEDVIAARELENVRLYPYQPRERLAALLGTADMHLVSLKPELEGLLLPSKFYGIAAAARPTIFVGSRQGEIAHIVEEAQCGASIESGDSAGLLSLILELANDPERLEKMGARARVAFDARWEKRHGITRWQEIIDAAFDGEPRA